MNIFQKAEAYLNLTPVERATLTTLWSLLRAAIITGLVAIANAAAAPGDIRWLNVLYVGIIAVVFSFSDGVAKYFTARGDPALGSAIEAVNKEAKKKVPPSLPVSQFVPMPLKAPAMPTTRADTSVVPTAPPIVPVEPKPETL